MKMQKTRMMRLAGVTAVVLSAGLWALVPAWGQSSQAKVMAGMGSTGTVALAKDMAGMGGTGNAALTKDIAAARVATAKYATNLAAAKADGYQILTKEIPGMGFHFVNMKNLSGFDLTKPQILVYEHTGSKWQLGALEWVFTSSPKNPPLPNATFGTFPAACQYVDGTFVPEPSQADCPTTAPGTGAAFSFWHPLLYTMHFWIWYPNPAGLYSSMNPQVAPFNGG
jgi:hypothetical protein